MLNVLLRECHKSTSTRAGDPAQDTARAYKKLMTNMQAQENDNSQLRRMLMRV